MSTYRAIILSLLLVALATPAAAATYSHSIASFQGQIMIRATDGFTEGVDQYVLSAETLNDFTATTDTHIEETGIVGVINPLRAFSGYSRASLGGDRTWVGSTGSLSGITATVQFDSLTTYFADDQIALIPTSGDPYETSTTNIPLTVTAAGSVLFGGSTYPFSFDYTAITGAGLDVNTRASGNPDAIEWLARVNGYAEVPLLFAFEHEGISYTGRLTLMSITLVPEPTTAILTGLGLVGLAARRNRPR